LRNDAELAIITLMVCQNCGSNDIVTIQGQSYCINCGQLVNADIKPKVKTARGVNASAKAQTAKTVTSSKPVKAAPAVASAVDKPVATRTAPRNTKPATPKQDIPKPAAKINIASKTSSKPLAFMPTSPAPTAGAKPVGKTLNIAVKVAPIINHSRKSAPIAPAVAKRISDISARPSQASPAVLKSPKPPSRLPVKPVKPQPVHRPARPVGKAAARPHSSAHSSGHNEELQISVGVWRAVAAAAKAVFNLHCWRFGLPLGLLFLSCFFAAKVLLEQTSESGQVIGLAELTAGEIQVAMALIACLAVTYVYRSYSRTAVAYGFARISDHRPARLMNWRQAGLESLWSIVGIDLLVLLMAVPLLAARWALSRYVEPAVYQPGMTELILSVVGNLLVIYAGLGLLIGSWLGRYAVALGGLPSHLALKTGLIIYFKKFSQVLWAATIGLAGAITVTAIYVGLRTALNMVLGNHPYPYVYLVVWALLAVLYVGVILIAGSAYGMATYRGLVARHFQADLGRLAIGRQPSKPSTAALVYLGLCAVVLIGSVLLAALMPEVIINLLSFNLN
jgi:transcription initiation factor TFIIIB Brf1 subunit/transcription initiation factor TFIIB